MKYLKGTAGSKRGLYKLVSRYTRLPKMQEVDILPWGGGIGLCLRWRGGSATLAIKGHRAQLNIDELDGRGDTVTVSLNELEKLGLIEEV